MKQKTEDYKISAVNYYLKNNDNIRKTCKIFDCKKSSLQRWIKRYETSKNLTRKNRQPISYKVKKEEVKTALNILNDHEQFTMSELLMMMRPSYLCRETSNQALKPSCYNQTLHGYEKTQP